MRKSFLAAAAALAAGVLAASLQERPCNRTCPVLKDRGAKPSITSVYEGRVVAFCCVKCKKAFDTEPEAYVENLPPPPPPPKGPEPAQIGMLAPDVVVKDADGNEVRLLDFKNQIVILQWTDPDCTVAERLATSGVTSQAIKQMGDLSKKVFHFSVCSSGASPADVSKFLSKAKVDTRLLMDPTGKAAKQMGARTSSHCFVIDDRGVVRYSGAFDNDSEGKKGEHRENYLVAVVKAIVDGKRLPYVTTAPYGTPLKLSKN